LCIIDFHTREDDLKNELKNTKEKVQNLEVNLREAEAGGVELKQLMESIVDNEYAMSQKLAYEKQARKDLEVSLEVALKVLRNDQVIIAGQEVELNNLKNTAHFVMDMVETQVTGEEPKSSIDRLLAAPENLVNLLKATSLTAATESLMRVKSHHPDVDMVKVGEGPDATKDLRVVEEEARGASMAIIDAIDYEGDNDGE
jgi:chromosome segregation ATPase